jgi:hypothetical protein
MKKFENSGEKIARLSFDGKATPIEGQNINDYFPTQDELNNKKELTITTK